MFKENVAYEFKDADSLAEFKQSHPSNARMAAEIMVQGGKFFAKMEYDNDVGGIFNAYSYSNPDAILLAYYDEEVCIYGNEFEFFKEVNKRPIVDFDTAVEIVKSVIGELDTKTLAVLKLVKYEMQK